MKKIIVCPDSFKGSLSASEATRVICESLKEILTGVEIVEIPLADGGEGTCEILSESFFTKRMSVESVDAAGRDIDSYYLYDESGKKAFIESALTIGLPLLPVELRHPLKTSSQGLGKVIMTAVRNGCREITIALGGSATCDGGMGMLSALGFHFIDKAGNELTGSGEDLKKIVAIIPPHNMRLWRSIDFKILNDVKNPLLGPYGSAPVYAPQKGASPEDVAILEEGLNRLVEVSAKAGYKAKEYSGKEGAGAAGGIGFAAYCFLNGKSIKGIDYILEVLAFDDKINDADLIITGEGKIDQQSLMGKVLTGVLSKARSHNIPVIALAGKVEDKEQLLSAGLSGLYSIANEELAEELNLRKETAIANLREKVRNIFFVSPNNF